jgi:hypothetical protein
MASLIFCSRCHTLYPFAALGTCPNCEPATMPDAHELAQLADVPVLSPEPLTPAQERVLMDDVLIAIRRCPTSCTLCGFVFDYQYTGKYGRLCSTCANAREHTAEALHAIDRLRTLDLLEEEGL